MMPKTRMKIGDIPVIDSTKSFDLRVTANDIARGNPKDPRGCAGAVAVKRQVPDCSDAAIHSERVYILKKDKSAWIRFRTPKRLHEELVAFDRGGKMEPFECTLSPLSKSRRTGKRQGGNIPANVPRRRSTPLKRVRPRFITGIRDRGANR